MEEDWRGFWEILTYNGNSSTPIPFIPLHSTYSQTNPKSFKETLFWIPSFWRNRNLLNGVGYLSRNLTYLINNYKYVILLTFFTPNSFKMKPTIHTLLFYSIAPLFNHLIIYNSFNLALENIEILYLFHFKSWSSDSFTHITLIRTWSIILEHCFIIWSIRVSNMDFEDQILKTLIPIILLSGYWGKCDHALSPYNYMHAYAIFLGAYTK
jgi:hypothetical protein